MLFLHLLELDKSLALDLRRSFSTFSVCLRSRCWIFRSTEINIIVLACPLACLHHGCWILRAKEGITPDHPLDIYYHYYCHRHYYHEHYLHYHLVIL